MLVDKRFQTAVFTLTNRFFTDKQPTNKFYTDEYLAKYGLVIDESLKHIKHIVLNVFKEVTGLDQINNTFWSFYQTIKHEADGTRILHQLIHYITTYGAEALGIDIETYIPNEVFGQITPDQVVKNVHVIKALTYEDLIQFLKEFVSQNRAIDDESFASFKTILSYMDDTVKKLLLSITANRQLKILILNLLPQGYLFIDDVDDLLVYLINLVTHKPLKIKSRRVLQSLRLDPWAQEIFTKWIEYDPKERIRQLAETWRRNREYYLHLKSYENRTYINKARKLADKLYKPVKLFHIFNLNKQGFKSFVKNQSTQNLVKYLYYLRNTSNELRFAIIRDGKFVIYDKQPKTLSLDVIHEYHDIVFNELKNRIRSKLSQYDMIKISSLKYRLALPMSLKHLIGGKVPIFSTMSLNDNRYVYIGIHWKNHYTSVDLDLHVVTESGQRVGWNSDWVDGETIIFSGDMTDAPRPYGATEMYRIDLSQLSNHLFFSVYDFRRNFMNHIFSLLILASVQKKDIPLSLSDVEITIPLVETEYNQTLGYIDPDDKKFVFFNKTIDKTFFPAVTDDSVESYVLALKALKSYKPVFLDEFLFDGNISFMPIVIGNVQQKDTKIYDLSIQNLSRDIWIDLLS